MRFLAFICTVLMVLGGSIKAQEPIRIVCIGNSISQGKVENGQLTQKSYRPFLWNKLDSIGLLVDFVGYNPYWFTEGTNLVTPVFTVPTTFPRYHECYYGINTQGFLNGISGGGHPTIPAFSVRLQSYEVPDMALIHIGTNNDASLQVKIDNIKLIIDQLRDRNPNITILLATLIDDWNVLNAEIPGIVAAKNTTQSPVIMVDQASDFENDPAKANTDTWDWVHPNDRGCIKMANKWFTAIVKTIVDTEKPTTPANLTATALTTTSATLTWTASTDNLALASYAVYANNTLIGSTTTNSFTKTGLNAQTAYTFTVKALDYAGNSSDFSNDALMSCSVTFNVKSGDNAPVADAQVTFNNETKTTDALGKVVFLQVTAGADLAYEVLHPMYETDNGTFSVTTNTTRAVQLSLKTGTDLTGAETFRVYPNPASKAINVIIPEAGMVNLYDVTGRLCLSKSTDATGITQLNTTGLTTGSYVLIFRSRTTLLRKLVQIN